VTASREVGFRLRLAEGFLAEARQDRELGRWRSCVDNSQLAVENAAKAALALLGPVSRTHSPAIPLREAVAGGRFAASVQALAERLALCAELLGPDLHAQSDYGDEALDKTPWELFGPEDAAQALALAEEAVHLASQLLRHPG
jgi:HEPN domain-containing protein